MPFSRAVADNMRRHSKKDHLDWFSANKFPTFAHREVLWLPPSDSGSFTDWRICQGTSSTNSCIKMLTRLVAASDLEGFPSPDVE